MTPPAGAPAPSSYLKSRTRRTRRTQRVGALLAAVAAMGLVVFGLPGPAKAASPGYDQITGVGTTASGVTVAWTSGLLDASNNPIAGGVNADRASATPTSPQSFMYQDFKNLKVTVSQTKDIAHQGLTVTWTGGAPTVQVGGTVQGNYLQMMECWGDATSGPTPEQCEFGSAGLLTSNAAVAQRDGPLCAAGTKGPSVTNPPASLDGSSAFYGCDPVEPKDPTHSAPCPGTNCNTNFFHVPFEPVDPTAPLDYNPNTDSTYYSIFNTDEVQEAVTAADGTGQQQFETLTGTQAPALGCGQADPSTGQARGCWLVIVPRGTFEPNGFQINTNDPSSYLDTSPLSASNWDQRIQIHLDFAPVASFCPLGTLEIPTVGTQVVTRAMQSWQLALNAAANCKDQYSFTAVPEATSTQQLTSTAGGTAGLAFTTVPIGSEAVRAGKPAPTLPPILYAPVAVSALDFGFNINYTGIGYDTTPVKLTPLLLAKAITQSYRQDLPDFFPDNGYTGPSWAKSSPLNITEDPEFRALNPKIPSIPSGPIAPLLTEDHSGINQQVWQWIKADGTASGWLGGAQDANAGNMIINPDYHSTTLNLATAPVLDSFPRAYTGELSIPNPDAAPCPPSSSPSPSATGIAPCVACPSPSPSPTPSASASPGPPTCEVKDSLDLLPYTENYDTAASAVLTANNPDESGGWDRIIQSPSGTPGWWDKRGVEGLGGIFMWSAADTSNLAAYGLVGAQLCNGTSSTATCVGPSVASLTAAVNSATPDSAGLLQVNPASP